MDASNIIKRRNNSTLYNAYITKTLNLSNPNTRQNIIQTYYNTATNSYTNVPSYTCDNFNNFRLQKDVYFGGKVCGNHGIQDICGNDINATTVRPYVRPVSKLRFTTGPTKICPNIEFYQGTGYINEDYSSTDICPNISFYQGTNFTNE